MDPSTKQPARDRAVVCQRSNELADFTALLTDLGIEVEVHAGELPTTEMLAGASLVIVPGQRLAEGRPPALQRWPRTIAVVDDGSKTLAAHLNRIGVAMVVRRPIHPRALRLLMLHEVYRGPERRSKRRVLIGHPIRAGVGLFKQNATLLELSRSGARIALANPPKVGTLIQFVIGKELTNARPIKLRARVVRSIRPTGTAGRTEGEVGLSLLDAVELARPIQAILDRFASGPATLGTAPRTPGDVSSSRAMPAPVSASPTQRTRETGTTAVAPTLAKGATESGTAAPRPLPPSFQPEPTNAPAAARPLPPSSTAASALVGMRDFSPDPQPSETDPAAAAAAREADRSLPLAAPFDAVATEVEILGPPLELLETGDEGEVDFELELEDEAIPSAGETPARPSDRRQSVRVPYPQRVVALTEQAARVVVGRDLCFGGMRIASHPGIAIGDVLRIALHAGTETEPLVVLAGVERDDGEDGLVLAFAQLTPGQRDRLEKILAASSPIQGVQESAVEGESLVVGELLGRVARGCPTT